MKYKVSVLGAGNMGTAIAQLIADNGHEVSLWDYNPETVNAIKKTGANEQFLPGVKLSLKIKPQADMAQAVSGCNFVVVAVASPFVRKIANQLSKYLRGKNITVSHIAKGLEEGTYLTMHEVIQSEFPARLRAGVVTISGPSIAKELVRGVPTAVVASSKSMASRNKAREVFSSRTFKVDIAEDYRGAGLCGALKNVYAIAHGMCDGAGLPMNAKAFLMTVALHEMGRIIIAFGGKKETAYSLVGIGDLVVTSLGDGRNRFLGERIVKDGSCKFLCEDKSNQTFEGVAATKSILMFTKSKKIKAPLLEMVHRVIYGRVDPRKELEAFFSKIEF